MIQSFGGASAPQSSRGQYSQATKQACLSMAGLAQVVLQQPTQANIAALATAVDSYVLGAADSSLSPRQRLEEMVAFFSLGRDNVDSLLARPQSLGNVMGALYEAALKLMPTGPRDIYQPHLPHAEVPRPNPAPAPPEPRGLEAAWLLPRVPTPRPDLLDVDVCDIGHGRPSSPSVPDTDGLQTIQVPLVDIGQPVQPGLDRPENRTRHREEPRGRPSNGIARLGARIRRAFARVFSR